METNQQHIRAKELKEEGRFPESLEILNDLLDENPNDPAALFLLAGIMIHTQKRGLAYNLFARCAKLAPDRPEVWINYGRCQDDSPEGWEQSEWCFKHALEMHPESTAAMSNMAALEIQKGFPEKAFPWVNKCLELDPDYVVAKSTKGFASLMVGDWEDGWKNYDTMVGHRSRPDIQYGSLPRWDGSPNKTVIVNGEQGIGDECVYASVLADLAKDCKYVIYDCMPRLERLMQRSLPENVIVTGSRWETELKLPGHVSPDAYITQAGVCQYYRNKDEDFPGTPYLKADDQIRRGMRAMLDGLGPKPKIGFAWTGGTKRSRGQFRNNKLDQYTALLRNKEVDFISLQYKDCQKELDEYEQSRGIKIHHYDWITEAKDYDLTAGLVAELDLVIAVPTSVTQLAGGMGKDTWVLVPNPTGWLFNTPTYLWANSVKLFKDPKSKDLARALKQWLEPKVQAA